MARAVSRAAAFELGSLGIDVVSTEIDGGGTTTTSKSVDLPADSYYAPAENQDGVSWLFEPGSHYRLRTVFKDGSSYRELQDVAGSSEPSNPLRDIQ